jgi:hypothetical protein
LPSLQMPARCRDKRFNQYCGYPNVRCTEDIRMRVLVGDREQVQGCDRLLSRNRSAADVAIDHLLAGELKARAVISRSAAKGVFPR